MLTPVCRWHDELARMTGLLKGPMEWTHTPPRREMIDPTREIPALIDAVRAGLMSLSEVQRSFGYVPEEVIAELALDVERAKAAGLTLTTDPGMVSDSGVMQPSSAPPAASVANAPADPAVPSTTQAP